MLPAVKRNHKATLDTDPISNQPTDGVLPPELLTSQTPIAQMIPERHLSVHLVFAQSPGFSLHSPLTLALSPPGAREKGSVLRQVLAPTLNPLCLVCAKITLPKGGWGDFRGLVLYHSK